MNIKQIVYKLRELPEKDKRNLLSTSVVLTGLVLFGLWAMTIRHNLTAMETRVKMERDLEPLKNFSGSLTAGYNLLPNTKEN